MSEDQRPQWRTAIGNPEDDRIVVRGYDLAELIGSVSLASMVHLELTGELASAGAERMLEALFVSVVEHGISPSTTVSRFLAASGVPLQSYVAGGVMTFGDIHGGAGEQFAQLMQAAVVEAREAGTPIERKAAEIVADARGRRQPLPGYGHPQHPSGDPRAPVLLRVADETRTSGTHIELARAVETQLERSVGRRLPLNIDGAIGAIISDLGFDWRLARAFIVMPRTIGLAAHGLEELDREGGWRHVPLSEVVYDGESDRPLER